MNAQTKVTGSNGLNNVLASYDECTAMLEAEKVFTYGAIKAFGACLLGLLAGRCNRELEMTTLHQHRWSRAEVAHVAVSRSMWKRLGILVIGHLRNICKDEVLCQVKRLQCKRWRDTARNIRWNGDAEGIVVLRSLLPTSLFEHLSMDSTKCVLSCPLHVSFE